MICHCIHQIIKNSSSDSDKKFDSSKKQYFEDLFQAFTNLNDNAEIDTKYIEEIYRPS